MAVSKLSQIAPAGGAPAVTDQAVFVTGGATDNLVTVTQLGAGLPIATTTTRGQVPVSGGGTTTFLRADISFAVPPNFTATTPGYAPLSGGGTTNFLRADGTWQAPPGGTPGAPVNSFQWNSAGAFAGATGFTFDSTNQAATLASIANPAASTLTLTGGTGLTTSQPVLNATQTWNAGGVTFSGLRYNITNTASAAASKIFDFQVATATCCSFTPNDSTFAGVLDLAGANVSSVGAIRASGRIDFGAGGARVGAWNASFLAIASGANFGISSTNDAAGGADTTMSRVTAKVVQFGDSSGNNANGWVQWQGEQRVTSDQTFTSNVALTTIMTVNVQAGRTYSFDVYLSITGSAGGVQAAISGTATTTDVRYDGYVIDNAAGGTKGAAQAAALGTAVANPATITGPASAVIRGTVTVNAAGTLTVQAAQATSSGTSTVIKRGSYAWFHDMP